MKLPKYMPLWRISYLIYFIGLLCSLGLTIVATFLVFSGENQQTNILFSVGGLVLTCAIMNLKDFLDHFAGFKLAEKEFDSIAGYKEEDE